VDIYHIIFQVRKAPVLTKNTSDISRKKTTHKNTWTLSVFYANVFILNVVDFVYRHFLWMICSLTAKEPVSKGHFLFISWFLPH